MNSSAKGGESPLNSVAEGLALHEIILDDAGRPRDYRFLDINPAYESLMRLRAADVVGHTVLEVLPGTSAAWIERCGAVALTGVPSRVEIHSSEIDGRETGRYFEIVAYSPQRGQFATMVSDITHRKRIEQELSETNSRLKSMVYDVAEAMGRIIEIRDPYTQGHTQRVAHLAKLLANEMKLSADEVAGVAMAGVVHDIGKLSVSTDILSKPGPLSDCEFALVREHPRAGFEILKDIPFPWPVAEAVLQHHERMDGSGYPQGLQGEAIGPAARILAVADVVEAMAWFRSYRPALGVDAAVAEVVSHPEQYDTNVLAACKSLHKAGRIAW